MSLRSSTLKIISLFLRHLLFDDNERCTASKVYEQSELIVSLSLCVYTIVYTVYILSRIKHIKCNLFIMSGATDTEIYLMLYRRKRKMICKLFRGREMNTVKCWNLSVITLNLRKSKTMEKEKIHFQKCWIILALGEKMLIVDCPFWLNIHKVVHIHSTGENRVMCSLWQPSKCISERQCERGNGLTFHSAQHPSKPSCGNLIV